MEKPKVGDTVYIESQGDIPFRVEIAKRAWFKLKSGTNLCFVEVWAHVREITAINPPGANKPVVEGLTWPEPSWEPAPDEVAWLAPVDGKLHLHARGRTTTIPLDDVPDGPSLVTFPEEGQVETSPVGGVPDPTNDGCRHEWEPNGTILVVDDGARVVARFFRCRLCGAEREKTASGACRCVGSEEPGFPYCECGHPLTEG